jgi:hypothetical protein
MELMEFIDDPDGAGHYESLGGWAMRREEGFTPNGNPVGHRWVLRDGFGTFVDVDKYRHDLAERNDFKIVNE